MEGALLRRSYSFLSFVMVILPSIRLTVTSILYSGP